MNTPRKESLEEETKESSPRSALDAVHEHLPEQIKGKKYSNERQLIDDLEMLGLRDLQITLDKEGFAVWREIPGEQHHCVVDFISDLFHEWENGRMLKGRKERNVFVNDSLNTPKNHLRVADFAIFGPNRLEGQRGRIRTVNKRYMNPHVIFQFSWANNIVKKALAVDDMMHHAGMGEYNDLGRPNIAYLIKTKTRGTENNELLVYGFDIFVVGQQESTPGEPTMKYRVGVQEDTVIQVSPASMGLDDEPGEPFQIEMRSIREELERLDTKFVAANENGK